MSSFDHALVVARLRSMQEAMRRELRRHMGTQRADVLARVVRDDAGDTIFGIDAHIEGVLLAQCKEWGRTQHFVLLAEGLDPAGVEFGRSGRGGAPFRLLVDPIDGTRGLMFDKRSAWCLMGAAPDRGTATRLSDVEVAVMSELPTTRQAASDVLWAVPGSAHGERQWLGEDGAVAAAATPLGIQPSRATDLRYGFATVCNYFHGAKELLARLEEAILTRALGGWNPAKAEVFTDQYISSGGMLAELALGRDRFVLDVRPLAYQKLGARSPLACRPYDVVTARIAAEAGCVIRDPFGGPLDAPLDVTTNVAFACYANPTLAAQLIPIVRDEVTRHLL